MRIPSQFTEDNLYRRGSRPHDSGGSLGRILRLVIALVLLLVVMQYAAKPRMYEVFFGAQGETEAETVGTVSESFRAALVATQQQRVADIPASEACRRLAAKLTRQMKTIDQRQWAAVLTRWNAGKPFPLMQSLVEQTAATLTALDDVDSGEQQAWAETLKRFGNLYGDAELVTAKSLAAPPAAGDQISTQEAPGKRSDEAELSDEDAVRLIAWLTALDAAALNRVVDGSVWRSADFDAFYLQLEQAGSLRVAGAATTAVVPLLQQPEVYRGQRLRVSGTVAKADRMDASANPHSIQEYWQLWIRPDSGGDRPMVLIVGSLPAKMNEKIVAGGQPHGDFVGRFFKRLAYRSQAGADLAPVVIGRVFQKARPVRMAPVAASDQSISDKHRFLLTLLVASVIGVSIAAVTMWRTSVAARRARELRTRQQNPDSFLGELRRTEARADVEGQS